MEMDGEGALLKDVLATGEVASLKDLLHSTSAVPILLVLIRVEQWGVFRFACVALLKERL